MTNIFKYNRISLLAHHTIPNRKLVRKIFAIEQIKIHYQNAMWHLRVLVLVYLLDIMNRLNRKVFIAEVYSYINAIYGKTIVHNNAIIDKK